MDKIISSKIEELLHGLSKVLNLSSVTLAKLDPQRGGLVLSFGIGKKKKLLEDSIRILGFDPTQKLIPFSATESLFIRCYREGKIISTKDVGELAKGILPQPLLNTLKEIIGSVNLWCIPVISGSFVGGVLVVEKEDKSDLLPEERRKLIVYASKIGNLLEYEYKPKESKNRFRSYLLSTFEKVVIQVDKELRIINCNDATQFILGYEPKELIGMTPLILLPGGKANKNHYKLFQRLSKDGYIEREINLVTKNGKLFPALVSAYLLANTEGENIGALITIKDISTTKEQKLLKSKLEKKLIQNERLAFLGEIAAKLIHEIKNPLSSIGMALYFIIDSLENEEKYQLIKEKAKMIQNEIKRLELITDSFLGFLKPKSMEPKATIPVALCIKEAIEVISNLPELNKNYNIKTDLIEDIKIKGDPLALRSAFFNIIKNSIEASPEGSNIEISMKKRDSKLYLEFKDYGVGIPKNLRKKVFEPFFTTKTHSTGLGLSITKQIIEEHKGKIKVTSKEGKGTTFTIIFNSDDER